MGLPFFIRKKHRRIIRPVQMICLSFLALIVCGAALLSLPISSNSGEFTSFFDCLFTATSASCVTGLVVYDTFTHWSVFGRCIIIMMIQLGGLGVLTFTTLFTVSLRGKLGLRDLRLASEQISISDLGDVQALLGNIIKVTFTCEAIGALLLCIPFCTRFGFNGFFIAVFTAISAYCNAGFDVVGFLSPGCSLVPFSHDPIVILVVGALIIIGGLGFVVFHDILTVKKREKSVHKFSFHTKMVLLTTMVLIVCGTGLILWCEWSNTLKEMPFLEKLGTSFFSAVTPRTAGYNMIDYSQSKISTQFITILLMFIGASPGSTGGGVKTTTMVVLLMTTFCVLRKREDTVVFGRRIGKNTVYKAFALVFLVVMLLIVSTFILWEFEPGKNLLSLAFEVVSAFSTTGLSAVGTANLGGVSRAVLIMLMYLGRVGPITFALMFGLKPDNDQYVTLPEGKLYVG